MRMLCLLVLILLAGVIGIFVLQNPETITLQFLGQSVSCPPALLIAATFLLGMVGGGTLVSFVRHSWRRVTAPPPP